MISLPSIWKGQESVSTDFALRSHQIDSVANFDGTSHSIISTRQP